MAEENPETAVVSGFSHRYLFRCALLVAGVGLEPHDLRVMSPTSYQLLYPAIYSAPCGTFLLYHSVLSLSSLF